MIPVSYNLRSLAVRKRNTVAAASGLAMVVFVFSAVLMLAEGIERTLGRSGEDDVAILLRKGADAELSSGIDAAHLGITGAAAEVSRLSDGTPQAIGEVVVVLAQPLAADPDRFSNVTVRGVPDNVYRFRPAVKIIEGRMATPGTDEAVIGKAIHGRFTGMSLGQSFELRKNRPVKVVGVFDAQGSSYDSEVWADIDAVRGAFGRMGGLSSIRVRLQSPSKFDAFRARIETDRQLSMQVQREKSYYDKQSEGLSLFITAMGMIIAVLFSAGAMIGAMNTMYASIAHRKREIGTLLALGFSRMSVLGSFLMESVLLALIGGGVGALLSLIMGFVKFSTMNMRSWSEITVTFEPTASIVLGALFFAGAMGVLGGIMPAIRASRMSPVTAMRE